MATNKHAIIRYQALDRCFQNRYKNHYIEDLVEACCVALYDYSGISEGVKRRQVIEDIKFMESVAGYSIPLERVQDGKRVYYRYEDKNFSINSQPISLSEAEQLRDTIVMLNRFKGLPQFDWMEEVLTRFEDTFKLRSNVESVVEFEQNPYLRGLEFFTDLFNAILGRQVLKVSYQPAFGEVREYIMHPYYLKQYNSRWFLFGLVDGRLMNMAIDRIDSFEHCSLPYIANQTIDFAQYFEDVVGVTVNERSIETILLKIDRGRYNYIVSKPIHESQSELSQLCTEEYVVIRLKLIPNYEFETLLLGFADSVEILEPESLRQSILERARGVVSKNS
ncbi:MAG: helix-turn-helix transcriptional regulator [Bacteroidales bacterium]